MEDIFVVCHSVCLDSERRTVSPDTDRDDIYSFMYRYVRIYSSDDVKMQVPPSLGTFSKLISKQHFDFITQRIDV